MEFLIGERQPVPVSGFLANLFSLRCVLPAPIGIDKFGSPLFDLDGVGQCPLDGSFQNDATRDNAEAWWSEEVRRGTYGKNAA